MISLIESGPLLVGAAFLAGGINAAAGGGSFLTLPALIHSGVPPVVANATGTLALLPGYISSTIAFRRDLVGIGANPFVLSLVCAAGASVGALLLMLTTDEAFRRLVPYLLLFATCLFAFAPLLQKRLSSLKSEHPFFVWGSLFLVSIYGGYFNGGLGIMLLAQLSLSGIASLAKMNALKNLFSSILTSVAVMLYIAGGSISWLHASIMILGTVTGGYVGARVARRIPASWLRTLITMIGLLTAIAFWL
jgi:uncharacterized protein